MEKQNFWQFEIFKKQQFLSFYLEKKVFWIFCEQEKEECIYYKENLDSENIFILKDLLESFKGKIFCFDLKQIYKKLFEIDNKSILLEKLFLSKNFVDVKLGVYLENSDQNNEYLEVFESKKQNIKETFGIDLKQLKQNLEKSDSIFEESIVENVDKVSNEFSVEVKFIFYLGLFYEKNFNIKTLDLWQNLESPLATILAKMELEGVFVDKPNLRETGKKLLEIIKETELIVKKELNSNDLNLNSPNQLSLALVKNGFKLTKSTSGGKISTNKKVLDELSKIDKTGVISKILEHRTASRLYSTYTENLILRLDKNSRLHGEFLQSSTATGRISSQNPNLQNIPIKNVEFAHLIRASFAAPNNSKIISSDYSQVELRLLAHFCEDPKLIQAFAQNQDIHTKTASEIFGIEIQQITKKQREIGKTLNFALVYQQGIFATASQLNISNKEAKDFIKKYFETFPKIKPFIEETLEKARQEGFVETFLGRRRYFLNLNSANSFLRKNDERAAFNAILQGSGADIIKMAMLRISQKIKSENLQAQIVLQIHDELVVEVKDLDLDKFTKVIVKEMELSQLLKVPLKVDLQISQNWAA
jgi:DNA polymerase I